MVIKCELWHYNHNHDALGRFASSSYGGSKRTYRKIKKNYSRKNLRGAKTGGDELNRTVAGTNIPNIPGSIPEFNTMQKRKYELRNDYEANKDK